MENKEFNVLSLFDGISCGQIALNKSGIKYGKYYASEIDKHPINVTQHNYPDTIQLGDCKNWKDWDIDFSSIGLLQAGFPCFGGETLSLTIDGYKKISDVVIGDYVLTHNNRFRKVSQTMNKVSNHINVLKIQGNPTIEVTDEHPFYTRTMYRKWTKVDGAKGKSVRALMPVEWKNVKDLTTADMIGVPINNLSIMPTCGNIDFGNEFMWKFLGRWLADGWSSTTNLISRGVDKGVRRKYTTVICCGKQDEAELEELLSKIPYTCTKVEDRTAFKYFISDKNLWEFIQKFGRGAKDKHIPNFILNSPKKYLLHLIDGYASGDGHTPLNTNVKSNIDVTKITSISLPLLLGVQSMVAKVYGTYANIHKCVVPPTKIIEGRLVNQHDYYVISYYKKLTTSVNYMVEDGFIWAPFKKIERLECKIEVFNFEVEQDNSYSVNNLICHNCQSWSIAGKQGGVNDVRGQLLFTMMDIFNHIRTLNPDVLFLFENVKMKKEFQEYVDGVIGCKSIFINSMLVSSQNRNRQYWTNIPSVCAPDDRNITLSDILERNVIDTDSEIIAFDGEEYHLYAKNGKRIRLIRDIEAPYTIYETRTEFGKQERTRLRKELGRDTTPRNKEHKEYLPLPTSKSNCLLTSLNALDYVLDSDNNYRTYTIKELCRLQNVPVKYFDELKLSKQQIRKMVGNGWTVDVVAHIFSFIPKTNT